MNHHQFHIEFSQRYISTEGPNIDGSDMTHFCHHYELSESDKTVALSGEVQLCPVNRVTQAWLYGPASDLASKSVIYPCRRYRCSLPCPCFLCRKVHPTCRAPTSKSCSCEDCRKHFLDHERFHAVKHEGCRACHQLMSLIPHFNFFFFNPVFEENIPLKNWKMVSTSKSNDYGVSFNLSPSEIAAINREGGYWCFQCSSKYDSPNDLKKHILKKPHICIGPFLHRFRNSSIKKDELFVCYKCSASFATNKELTRHVEAKHYEGFFTCDVCLSKFSRKDRFLRHMRLKHPDSGHGKLKFSCCDCEKSFTSFKLLEKHEKALHGEGKPDQKKRFLCMNCGEYFKLRGNFKIHIQNRIKEGALKYVCDQCNHSFCTRTSLIHHLQFEHPGTGSVKCYKCCLKFETQDQLDNHTEKIHFQETFECDSCEKSFAKKENLLRHQIDHKSSDYMRCDFKCDKCQSVFRWKTSFQRHMKDIYNDNMTVKNVCNLCDKEFCTTKFLKAHMKFQHETPNRVCTKCGLTFTEEVNLKRHVENAIKDGLAKYSCDLCLSTFCTRTTLTRHLESQHEGTGNFKCHKCSVNFESKDSLKLHKEKIHFNETFKCHDCERSFTRIETLKKHETDHKASDYMNSSFECEFCQSVFKWKKNWQRHMREIYNDDQTWKNVCQVCGENFCTGKEKKAHIDLNHILSSLE